MVLLIIALLGAMPLARSAVWHGDGEFHTVLESVSTLFALIIGGRSSQRLWRFQGPRC
jgi:hypothetical protein